LWYGRFGRRLVIRISVPSLTLCHFVHLTNKRLVTCNLYMSGGKSHTLGCNPVARGPGSILFYRERRSECMNDTICDFHPRRGDMPWGLAVFPRELRGWVDS